MRVKEEPYSDPKLEAVFQDVRRRGIFKELKRISSKLKI